MDVTESDHKPVRCKIHANIAHTDKSVRRQEMGKIVKSNEKLRSMFEELKLVPETSVSTNSILLQSQDTFIFTITNKSNSSRAIFNILCKGQTIGRDDGEDPENHSRGTFGLPRWLEVFILFLCRWIAVFTILFSSQDLIIKTNNPFSRFLQELG